jgi:hypothetical protein
MSNSSGPLNLSTVTVGVASAVFLAERPGRKYLLVQNQSAGDIWISFDDATAVADGTCMKLESGASWEPSHVPSNAMRAIGSAADLVITLVQG